MLSAVVNQSYTGSVAVDTSGMFNHGIPIQVTPTLPGFTFNHPGSRINIPPSASLNDLGCIEAMVTFSLSNINPTHRYNLAEGYLSFALYVNSDLSISGTILDANGNWSGAQSAPNTISISATQVAVLQSDGINMVRVYLDGQLVAENYNTAGPVRSIGSLGIAIGHWPDPPNQYTFSGTIFQFVLKKYDPNKDLTHSLNPCCFNRKALARWYREIEEKGITQQQISNSAQALKSATQNIAIALRGSDKSKTEAQQKLVSAYNAALRHQDCNALKIVTKEFHHIFSQLDSATQAKLKADLEKALTSFGLTTKDWLKFMNLLCLDFCNSNKEEEHHHGC